MAVKNASLYQGTPRQIKKWIKRCLMKGQVPFIKSSPGVGKSSIVHQAAEDFNLELIDHRLSTSAPEDMTGLPHFKDGKACFAPFEELFPLEDTPVPEGKDGWLLFLDEFNSCDKSIQAAAYKLILDRMTGQHKLHERVVIVCAGNLDTDRAIVQPVGTAMQSRVVTLRLELSYQEWLEDVAIPNNWDPRVIAFVSRDPANHLSNFRPDHNDETFACPRTLEFLSDLVKGEEITQEDTPLYAGTIGPLATTFVGFCSVQNELITIEEIIKNPDISVPSSNDARWLTVTYLAKNVDKDTFGSVANFISKMDLAMRVLFFRMMKVNNPELRTLPEYIDAVVKLDTYLNG